MLLIAAALMFATGLAHSYLGERFILIRLFRRGELPKLFGGTEFTRGTLRFAWHITTLAWWGFAALLVIASQRQPTSQDIQMIVAATAAASALLPIIFTRGRHLSWIVFAAVAALAYFAR